METIKERLARVRKELSARGLQAWIAATGDPHMNERTPDHWAFRRHLSGFTGSAGTLVVTERAAALWTDSRYWEQCRREIAGTGIRLMREGDPGTPAPAAWLGSRLEDGDTVGIDAGTLSGEAASRLQSELAARGIALADDPSFLDALWPDRPEKSTAPVWVLERAQSPRCEKLAAVRAELERRGAQGLFLSTLDDIAWLTNLRGSDVPCTPVFSAHLLVLPDSAVLFADERKFPQEIRGALEADGIALRTYGAARDALVQAAGRLPVLVDEARVCARFVQAARSEGRVRTVGGLQPTTLMKSRKTAAELEALRETMVQDGAAMCELLAWLDAQYAEGARVTEWDVSEKLLELRSRCPDFLEPSFETIAAAGPHAAEPHYTPSKESSAELEPGTMLLLDSGGQYLGGTTDLTRTVAFGEPTAAMKRDYTAVLRGHIGLACARFPKGVFAPQLDAFARAPLWEIGADYGHGTGHGVGFCLNVHEGPANISPRAPARDFSRVEPGLVISNEPGLYRPGRWGVRIENLVTPRLSEPVCGSDEMGDFLEFETLTLCPIDTRLIHIRAMSPAEIRWVNNYHLDLRAAFKGRLSPAADAWLVRACDLI